MNSFYFDFRDLFKAPRAAIGPQRILSATVGLLFIHLIYTLFSYSAMMASGHTLEQLWTNHGLFILTLPSSTTTASKIILIFGLVICSFLFLLLNTMISRVAYMHIRQNLMYTWKMAYKFAISRSTAILTIYITYIFLILPFIAGALIMVLLGKIPWVGDLLNAFATLPYIFAGMILVFLAVSVGVASLFGPAILASSEEDGFGTSVLCLRLTWGQPIRLLLYTVITLLLTGLALGFFVLVLKVGLIIYSNLFMPLMNSMAPMLDNALYYAQSSLGGLDLFIREQIGEAGSKAIYLKKTYSPVVLGLSEKIASFLIYLFLLFAGYMSTGYALAVTNTAALFSLNILGKKMQLNDLLSRQDSEIPEEGEEILIKPDSDDVKNLGSSGEMDNN